MIKKISVVIAILALVMTIAPVSNEVSAVSGCYLSIGIASSSTVEQGGSVSYTLTYTGSVDSIWISTGSIVLNGFTATVNISGTGNTRTVTLSNIQGTAGSKTISVTGGTAASASGDLANSVTSKSFTLSESDTESPVLTISDSSVSSVFEGESLTYTLTYTDDKAVSSVWLSSGSIVLNGFTATVSISGTGNTRTVKLSNIQGTAGSKTISVTGGTAADAAGNLANSAKSTSFTLKEEVVEDTDDESPVLTISAPSKSSVYVGESLTYTLYYTDDVEVSSIWLSTGSIVLNGFTATVSISGTGNTRTVTLSNIQGDVGGSKTISVTGGTAADVAGNLANSEKSTAFTIIEKVVEDDEEDTQTDDEAPVLTITGPNKSIVYAGETVIYIAKYTDNIDVVSISLTEASMLLNGFTADIKIESDGDQRVITLSNIQGTVGTNKYISIVSGTAKDAMGNTANAATSLKFEIVEEEKDETTEEEEKEEETEKPDDWIENPNTGKI